MGAEFDPGAWTREQAAPLLRVLGAPRPTDAPLDAGDATYRGLFMPSSHPDCCIALHLRAAGTGVLVMCAYRSTRRSSGGGAPGAEVDVPTWTEAVELPVRVAARCARELDRLDVFAFEDARDVGLDGIELLGEVRTRHGGHDFTAWSPVPSSDHHDYFAQLHALASRHLTGEPATRLLEQLHGYLALGTPLKDLGGDPHRVRVFGRLTSDDEAGLREAFDAIPAEKPLLLDLTDIESIATLLHPLFVELHRKRRDARWLVGRHVYRQLLEAGIPRDALEISL